MVAPGRLDALRRTIEGVSSRTRVVASTNARPWENAGSAVLCAALRRSLLVLPDGDVGACEKMAGVPAMTVGNVRAQSLSALWNSDRIGEIIDPPPERFDPVCAGCGNFDSCRSGCFAIKHNLALDMYGIDPRCMHAPVANNPYKAG